MLTIIGKIVERLVLIEHPSMHMLAEVRILSIQNTINN